MPKQKKSPASKFPGHIVLPDGLVFEQYAAWQDAVFEAIEIEQEIAGGNTTRKPRDKDLAILRGICACVSEWHIEGQPEKPTPETFLFTPREQSMELIAWLFTCIRDLVSGEESTPNE